MGDMDFYKRYHDVALAGMRALPSDEYKAYGLIIDLIYSMDNRVPDDDLYIAGWCGFRVSLWKKVKTSLIAKEKIYIENGFIRNGKADKVIARAVQSSQKVSESNAEKGRKSGAARRKNKGLAEPSVNHIELELEIDKEEENNPTLLPDAPDVFALAVKAWNEMVDWQISGEKPRRGSDPEPPRIAKVQAPTHERKITFEKRMKAFGGYPGWVNLLEIIKQSPHLLGHSEGGWTVSFDWVLKPKNLTKIMEGNYVRKSGNGKAGGTREALDWLHGEAERRESVAPGDENDSGEPKPER